MDKVKWTKHEIETHISTNIKDSYGAAIVCAALYKKLYGEYPRIGLSGFQAGAVEQVLSKLPDKD